jgi:membrane-associated phospholipid phosphatase
MLIKSLAVSVLVGASLYTFPAYANTTAPDLAPAAAVQETAADPSTPQLVASEPTAPVTLDASEPAIDPGQAGLQQRYTLSPSSTTGNIDRIDGKYLKGYFTDAGKILSSPMRWEGRDWLKAGIVAGITSSLFLVDQDVKEYSQTHQSRTGDGFSTVGNALGNAFYLIPGIGAAYLYGHFADNHRVRRTALLAFESYAISGLMTEGLKLAVERHRPNTGDANTSFDGPSGRGKNESFSSGHTASAFSIATIVANEYHDNPYVAPIAYGLATLTGLSRIYSNAHWSSDVFFGAALGYFTSKAVLSLHKEDKSPLFGDRLTLMPKFGKQLTGVEMKYRF